MAANGRIRAGVVGTGHMGQYHVLVYAELPDVELCVATYQALFGALRDTPGLERGYVDYLAQRYFA